MDSMESPNLIPSFSNFQIFVRKRDKNRLQVRRISALFRDPIEYGQGIKPSLTGASTCCKPKFRA